METKTQAPKVRTGEISRNRTKCMEASKLPEAEFKTIFIRMLKEHTENFKELSENFNIMKKDIEPARNEVHTNEMKDNLQGINSRVEDAENQIRNLEYMKAKNTQLEQQKGKKNEDKVKSLWNDFKHSNIHIMGLWKEKRRRH